ncbi:MAG: hypothetical protein LBL24_02745 [Bacteroidales bacterium]|jgi:hypothetical protein|nr:hypothetical protein [Bacteroidales bacterium]
MLKADIGDILYIVIFAVLMLAGGLEKYVKAKRQQQQDRAPRPPQSYDEDEEERPVPRQAPPQTLDEMLKRMLQPAEIREEYEDKVYPEEAQSLEVIPETSVRKNYYQPVVNQMMDQSEKEVFAIPVSEGETDTSGLQGYELDIRQAIIASEILNRKY